MKSFKFSRGSYNIELDDNDTNIQLEIGHNFIRVVKNTENTIETIGIHNGLYYIYNIISEPLAHDGISIISRKLEKRENGVIITDVQKSFSNSFRYNNELVLTDLYEKEYVFKKENIEKILKNVNFHDVSPTQINLKFKLFETKNNLKEHSDLSNSFSTHMNFYIPWDNGRMARNNIYSNHTYLNGINISGIYDIIDGSDKLYRIYDLYNGVINPKNEKDINGINLGLVKSKGFYLKELSGIKKATDDLIGKTNNIQSKYISYLKELFKNQYNYYGEISLNRDDLLNLIIPKTKEIEGKDIKPKIIKKIFKIFH